MKDTLKFILLSLFTVTAFITTSQSTKAYDVCAGVIINQAAAEEMCPGICSAYDGWKGKYNWGTGKNTDSPEEITCRQQGLEGGSVCMCNSGPQAK
jgi:hypothetical protein